MTFLQQQSILKNLTSCHPIEELRFLQGSNSQEMNNTFSVINKHWQWVLTNWITKILFSKYRNVRFMISGFCFLCLERSNMGWLPDKRPWCGGGGRLWGFWLVLPWLLWLYRWSDSGLLCCCRWWIADAALAIILFLLLTNLLVVTRPLEAEFRSIWRRAVRLSLSFFTFDIFSPNLKSFKINTLEQILVFYNPRIISFLSFVYLVYASSEAWTWTLSWMGPRDSRDLQNKVHFHDQSEKAFF